MNTVDDLGLIAIIVSYNEEVHIRRCIESIHKLTRSVYVVDSYSSDRTVDIARELGAHVVQRAWVNYAEQFQWALSQFGGRGEWIMRMDADEYIESELAREIDNEMRSAKASLGGIYVKRKVMFMGKWMRFGGTYPQKLLRVWRSGCGRIEQRWMDEHIVLSDGLSTVLVNGDLVDDNLKGISFWVSKCNSYASREAVDLLNAKYQFYKDDDELKDRDDPQAKWKRILKDELYSKLPPGLRSVLYFFYRYIVLLGFLDGSRGMIWHLMQGLWYRLLVDVKVMEITGKAGSSRVDAVAFIRQAYGLDVEGTFPAKGG